MIIIGVYAPYDSSDNNIKDDFYEDLNHVISGIRTSYDIIIAGDMNARVKSRENNEIVGKYAEEVENDSGEMLLELCSEHQLKLMNTYFPHKDIHRFTGERPSLNKKSIIDYIIARNKSEFRVNDARVKRGVNCGTDHHLLLATLVYPFPKKQNNLR
ncbi:craniofacial development protein 2-like [Sitophilus oryzae]|uniref:Craniofacial development protein 2-like n=1 Tax=Sitophilus oryzae TaxID=7048 RepID=A0A6J2Y3F2_SITOR|nr:craniofacial development protein 2-like [Sitophilus oryzae]